MHGDKNNVRQIDFLNENVTSDQVVGYTNEEYHQISYSRSGIFLII